MPLDTVTGVSLPSRSAGGRSRMFLVEAAPPCFGEIAPALAAADVVFHQDDIDALLLANIPRSAWVERLPVNGADGSTQSSALKRAHRLAADGWRVVWLAAAPANDRAADVGEAASAIAGATGSAASPAFPTIETFTAAAGFEPRLLATALNGLAG